MQNRELNKELNQKLNQELNKELKQKLNQELNKELNQKLNQELNQMLNQELNQELNQKLNYQLNKELNFCSPVIRASVGFPKTLVLKHQIFHKQSACVPNPCPAKSLFQTEFNF